MCVHRRLLNSSVDQWLHANCAVWCAEVREQQNYLENVNMALKRIKSTVSVCSICSKAGSGVACFACARSYHVQCARTAGHHFYHDKVSRALPMTQTVRLHLVLCRCKNSILFSCLCAHATPVPPMFTSVDVFKCAHWLFFLFPG